MCLLGHVCKRIYGCVVLLSFHTVCTPLLFVKLSYFFSHLRAETGTGQPKQNNCSATTFLPQEWGADTETDTDRQTGRHSHGPLLLLQHSLIFSECNWYSGRPLLSVADTLTPAGAGGVKRPKNGLCTKNQPQISGSFYKFQLLSEESFFDADGWAGQLGLTRTHAPPGSVSNGLL